MILVIGTDEAGYGPNLGPLSITGTAWLVERPRRPRSRTSACPDLFQVFGEIFTSVDDSSTSRIRVGDSKKLYQSGGGLADLERLVIPLVLGPHREESWRPTWRALREGLMLDSVNEHPGLENSWRVLPWYRDFDLELPIDLDPSHPIPLLPRADRQCPGACRQMARLIEARPFNDGIRRLGNKATVLSHETLSLVLDLVDSVLAGAEDWEIEQVFVYCDKHGGRSRYAGILQEIFADTWIQVVSEERERSCYRGERQGIPMQFEFLARGESQFAIAVSSMISKYLREVSMLAFNRFWLGRIHGLRPTAGYPVDASRFRSEIEQFARELELEIQDWWRER